MAGASPNPAQLDFVVTPPQAVVEKHRHPDYDLHVRPSEAPAPLVVFIHGPIPGGARPRDWPVYRGYASLVANAGLAAAVVDLDYTDFRSLDGPGAQLERVLEAARGEAVVDSERVVLWAFSAGALLMGRWLEGPAPWTRGVALTYPVAPAVSRVRTQVVLTRVGLERPEIQATVDRLLALATGAEVIHVDAGRHGFDFLDHNEESRRAITTAVSAVARLLV